MRSARLVLPLALLSACLDPAQPRRGAALTLRAIESETGELDAVGRVTTLRVRFDRAIRAPAPDDLILVRGAPSATLQSDLENLPLSSSTQTRRLPASARVHPDDPESLMVESLSPLAPDTEIGLMLSTRLRGADDARLEAPAHERLRVAPVTRCGALATLDLPGPVGPSPGSLPLRFDRGVRAEGAPLSLVDPLGAQVASASRLGCFDPQGFARCAWITPLSPLSEPSYFVRLGALRSRNDTRCEAAALRLEVTRERPPRARFATPLPCADDERSFSGICARVGAHEITLRAATTRPALLRARAAPEDQGEPRETLGPPGTAHSLRIEHLSALTRHALTLWAIDGRGEPEYLPLGAVETLAAQGDLRITEVLARPRGQSAQEFVEVENVGETRANLRGWSLASGTGASAIGGDLTLAPGARALIVGEGFDPRGSPREGDPAALPGATVVTLRGSIASRGLRDDGATLSLRDPAGTVVSVFPGADPARPPRAGVSLVRAAWDLDEGDAHAWSYDAEDGSTPGGANRAR